MHCRYAGYGAAHKAAYRLVVFGRTGPETIGSWSLAPGSADVFHSPTRLTPAQIGRVQLQLADGTAVLDLEA